MKVGQRIVEIVIKAKDDASQHVKSLGKSFDDLKTQVPLVGQAFDLIKNPIAQVTALLVGLSKAAIAANKANVELGAGFQDLSNRTDMTVESLAKWKYVAEQNGASLEDFEMVFKKLRKTMADAASGEKEAIDTFARMGISVVDADGKLRDLETVLLEIGQVIREHGMASIQAAAGQDALGRQSGKVVAVIKQQSDELKAQMGLAAAYTNSMTTAWASAADAADDAAARAKIASENIRAALMPNMAGAIDWWTDLRLSMFNAKGWVQVQKAEEEAAKLAARAVAVSYIGSFVDTTGQQAGPMEDAVAGALNAATQSAAVEKELADLRKKVAEAMSPPKMAEAVDLEDGGATIGTDEVMLLEDYTEQMAMLNSEAGQYGPALEGIILLHQQMVDGYAEGDEALKRLVESHKALNEAQQEASLFAQDLAYGLSSVAGAAAEAFMTGETRALMMGKMIRTVVISAIREMIAEFVKAKIIMAGFRLLGLPFAEGGTVPGYALGGSIPRAANGYAVPDGPRGMDSRLIMAMPGEEVINRSLSRRLDRFISAYEMGATVSPFALAGAGGGGGNVINFNVGRPVSVLDALDMGRSAVTASRKYSEASL